MASWSFAGAGASSEDLKMLYGQDQSNKSSKRAAFGSSTQEVLRVRKKARGLEEGEVEGEADEGEQLCNSRECKKRRLTAEQVRVLEEFFEEDNKLEPERKALIAKLLGLQARQVAIWFQNRRARWKTKQLEQGFEQLKFRLESALQDNKDILKQKDCVAQENKRLQEEVDLLKALLEGSGGSRFASSNDEDGDGDGDAVAGYSGTILKDDDACKEEIKKEEAKEEEVEEEEEEEEEEQQLQELLGEDGSCSYDGAKSELINSPTIKVGDRSSEVQDSCRSYPFSTIEGESQHRETSAQESLGGALCDNNFEHGASLGVCSLIKLEDQAVPLYYSNLEEASFSWLNHHHHPFVIQQLATSGAGAPYFEDAYTFITDQCVSFSWCD